MSDGVAPSKGAAKESFHAYKYREDFMGLTHQVREGDEIIDEALTPEDAQDLADAMNSLRAKFGLTELEGKL